MNANRFTARQMRVLLGCFIAYTAAYFGRVNLAIALPSLGAEMGLDKAQTGLLATLFAVTYGGGQIVSGYLSDRVSPIGLLLTGMLGTVACNALFGASGSYGLLLVLWCVNGAFQSTLWAPIVRLLSLCFRAKAQRRASFIVNLTMSLGYLAAWAYASRMTVTFAWRGAYFLAAGAALLLTLLAAAFLWPVREAHAKAATKAASKAASQTASKAELTASKLANSQLQANHQTTSELAASNPAAGEQTASNPAAGGNPAAGNLAASDPAASTPARAFRFDVPLCLVLICCAASGYVRDSVGTWAPTLLMESLGLDLSAAAGMVLIIPAVNTLGMLIGIVCMRCFRSRVRPAGALLMGVCVLCALALLVMPGLSAWPFALLLGLCSAMMMGVNPYLTTFIPLEYADTGRVGFTAGLTDAACYAGSGLSGILTGALAANGGWESAYLTWLLSALLGGAALLLSGCRIRTVRLKRRAST